MTVAFALLALLIQDETGLPINDHTYLQHMHWFGFKCIQMPNGCKTVYVPDCLNCLSALESLISDFVYPCDKYSVYNMTISRNDGHSFEARGKTSKEQVLHVKYSNNVLCIDVDELIVYYKKIKVRDFNEAKEITKEWFTWIL